MTINRIEILKSYVDEDPEDAFSRYALALEYVKLENDPAAEPLMEHLNKEQPDYLPNYYHYGKLLERKGLFKEAIGIYNAGIQIAVLSNDSHTISELRSSLEAINE